VLKKKIFKVLKFLAFFAAGVFIFWLIYKDQDVSRIKDVLTNDVDYVWIWVALFIGLLSHISRSLRWGLMIEPLGQKPRILNTFLAVMVGYLMNMVLPRMGEISRCGVLARYEKISFTKLIGTVVTERIIDMIMLLLFLVIVIFTQFGQVLRFIDKNPGIKEKLLSMATSPYLYAAIIIVAAVFFIYRKTFKNTKIYKKIGETAKQFKEGLISVKNIKRKGAFIFHSVFIWTMYYLMLYVVFFAFSFTSGLGPLAGLTTFVLASFGMVAPVQGGIGAWHFMAIEALALYGVAHENGVIFALLNHSATTVMVILLGLVSLLVLPFINRRGETAK